MNSKDFNELVEARCSKIKATLASKGKEYSTDDDKLHNFNKAGIRSGQSREKALMGMKLKHEISIDDIILNLDKGRIPTIEVIDEKIGDIINYFVLLEACLVDRIMKEIQDSLSTSIVEENSSKFLEGQINEGDIFNSKKDIGLDINRDKLDRYIVLSITTYTVNYFSRVGTLTKSFSLPIKVFLDKFILYKEVWKEDS